MKNKPSSLYIHIPFCSYICDYCDFTKLQYFRFMAEKYLDALKKEFIYRDVSKKIKTIYIGGGTPTVLDDDLLDKLLSMVDEYALDVEEYTVEANPENLTISKLKILKNHHVNRLSIGVESTNDKILRSINRHHTFRDVENCFLNARKLGFNNISVDLILGLPHVSKEMLKVDLDNILSLKPDHISCYSLTVHKNTIFAIKNIVEPKDDFSRDLYNYVHQRLEKCGFTHYEISNWCKDNKYSRHNLVYWRDETYYGLGLGASGYIDNIRYSNTKSFNKYLELKFDGTMERVTPIDDEEYFIFLNLRTKFGIDLRAYRERFNKDFMCVHEKSLNNFLKNKLLIYDKNKEIIYPSYEGMMILDTIVIELI